MQLFALTLLLLFTFSISDVYSTCNNDVQFLVKFTLPNGDPDFISDCPPENISTIAHRKLINVSNGKVNYLCSDIVKHFENTISIEFDTCDISEIEIGVFKNLTTTESITIIGNNLMELNSGIFTGLAIKHLSLENNNLFHISKHAFNFMPKLKTLNLKRNKITEIHLHWFDKKHGINLINLSFNKIANLNENNFKHLLTSSKHCDYQSNDKDKRCPIFDLSYNKIVEVSPDAFNKLTNIDSIILDNNELVDVPLLPSDIRVKTLSVQYNYIKYIYRDEIPSYYDTIQTIYLFGNPMCKKNQDYLEKVNEKHNVFVYKHKRRVQDENETWYFYF